jgi:hypothetical protein
MSQNTQMDIKIFATEPRESRVPGTGLRGKAFTTEDTEGHREDRTG